MFTSTRDGKDTEGSILSGSTGKMPPSFGRILARTWFPRWSGLFTEQHCQDFSTLTRADKTKPQPGGSAGARRIAALRDRGLGAKVSLSQVRAVRGDGREEIIVDEAATGQRNTQPQEAAYHSQPAPNTHNSVFLWKRPF